MVYSKPRKYLRITKHSKKYNMKGGVDMNDLFNMMKNILKVLRCQNPSAYRQAVLTQNKSESEYDVFIPWTQFPGDVKRGIVNYYDDDNSVVRIEGDREIIQRHGTSLEKRKA